MNKKSSKTENVSNSITKLTKQKSHTYTSPFYKKKSEKAIKHRQINK